MQQLRRIYWILCAIALACNANAMGFIDYKPTNFSEHATKPFFFSIGKKLKFGDAIREDAPTLFAAGLFDRKFTAVYPSPDQTQAAVVLGDTLYLIQQGKPPTKLLRPVEFGILFDDKVSLGDSYYEYGSLQWDAQSRYIFIPRRTKKMEPDRFNVTSTRYQSSLIRIDTSSPHIKQELIPSSQFPLSLHYFLLNEDSVCFNSATYEGDVIWKCWLSGNIQSVQHMKGDQITFDDETSIMVKPFVSYRYSGGSSIWLISNGYYLTRIPNSLLVDFFHKNKPSLPIFRVEGGIEWLKGHFGEGLDDDESTVLPGGRYAFLSFTTGEKLVVDSETGLYKEAPKDSRVYLNFNSHSNPDDFRIIDHKDGFFQIEFSSSKQLRKNYNH